MLTKCNYKHVSMHTDTKKSYLQSTTCTYNVIISLSGELNSSDPGVHVIADAHKEIIGPSHGRDDN